MANLLSHLQAYGLVVEPEDDWDTNTNAGRDRDGTWGIVNHWDAIKSVPSTNAVYMGANQYNGILYHIVIFPDGHLALLSQRYVYHAGNGDSQVLDALYEAKPTPAPREGVEDKSGNSRTVGVCLNYYPNGDALPAAQYTAMVKTNRALMHWFDLEPNQIIDHASWKYAKSDVSGRDWPAPKGFTLAKLRADVQEEEVAEKIPKPEWVPKADLDMLLAMDILTVIPVSEEYNTWRYLTFLARTVRAVAGDGTAMAALTAHAADPKGHVHRHSGGNTGYAKA